MLRRVAFLVLLMPLSAFVSLSGETLTARVTLWANAGLVSSTGNASYQPGCLMCSLQGFHRIIGGDSLTLFGGSPDRGRSLGPYRT
jgi:hypothetical protein